MSFFGGLPEQDLGDDFEFESDSRSLGEILGAEKPGHVRAAVTPAARAMGTEPFASSSGLTPARVMGTKSLASSGLTPAKVKAPPKSHLGQNSRVPEPEFPARFGLEVFQTKSGTIYWRQREADKGIYRH